MPRVNRPRWSVLRVRGRAASTRVSGDRGAAMTLVGILLAGGVLLGVAALVVDVGQLYAEREELVSGADAAAMAVALDCAMDRPGCQQTAAEATAKAYADRNARDGAAGVLEVCGDDRQGRLNPCTGTVAGNLTDCIGEPPTTAAYVEVRLRTEMPDGATLFPPTFAATFVNGYEGTEVQACARVAWGAPAGGLAVTLSACEWDAATQGGTRYPPAGAADDVLAEYEVTITFVNTTGTGAACGAGPSGFDAPGGFGWLNDGAVADCQTEIADSTYPGRPGNNVTGVCQTTLEQLRANRTVVPIPVFIDVTGGGANTVYTLHDVAGFVVTGYRLPGFSAPSTVSAQHLCGPGSPGGPGGGTSFCIYGYFVEGVIDWNGPIGGTPGLGITVVRTVG